MPGPSIYALTNLSAGCEFELPVEAGTDVVGAAKAYLADRDLPEDTQRGFFVSVFPTRDLSSGDASDRELPPAFGATEAGEDSGPRHAAPAQWYADQSTAAATAPAPIETEIETETETETEPAHSAVPAAADTSGSTVWTDYTPAPSPASTSVPVAEATDGPDQSTPEGTVDAAEPAQRPYLDPDPARVEVPLRWESEPDPTYSGAAEEHDMVTADEDAVGRAAARDYAAPGTVGLLPTPEQRRLDEEPSDD